MTTETTESPVVDTSAVEGGEVENQEVAIEPSEDPDESFSDWQKRMEEEKKAKQDPDYKEKVEKTKKQQKTEQELDDDPNEDFDSWHERKFGKGDKEEKEEPKEAKEDKQEKDEVEDNDENDESPPNEGEEAEGEEKAEEKVEESEEDVYKYTVDGEEYSVSKADTDAITEKLAKAEASDRRFQEAANMKREVTEFVKFAKTNPMEALAKLGTDAVKAAEDYIYKDMEFKSLPEAEQKAIMASREAEQLKRQLEEVKAKQEKEREEIESIKKNEEFKEPVQKQTEVLKTQFTEALAGQGLPANQYTISRMAMYLRQEGPKGTGDMQSIAKLVRKDYQKEMDELRKEEVKRYKEKQKQTAFKQNPNTVRKRTSQTKPKRYTSIYDMQF